MTAHELVIHLGRPFDVRTADGAFLEGVSEITIPFAGRKSAEAAQREITVTVRPVHDAGGEDYRPVVDGEVVQPSEDDLHSRRAHPDFEYRTTRGPRKRWNDADTPPEGVGWELNITTSDPEAWERFGYHEERYWRRRLPEPRTLTA